MQNIIWKPSTEFLKNSNIAIFMKKHGIGSYEELIKRSTQDIDWFWKACIEDLGVEWIKPYTKLYDSSKGFAWTKWFVGGELNIIQNCLDRHALNRGEATALIWEADDGETKTFSYSKLNLEIKRLGNALLGSGIKKGDAVGIYLPMIPEVVVSLLACFKIGAVAVPVFSGFGPEALKVRLMDSEAKVLITADGAYRRGKMISIKPNADQAIQDLKIKTQLVVKRTGQEVAWKEGRDLWWHDVLPYHSPSCGTYPLDSEHPCMVLYTSGTTGKPKGCVHTQAGALAQIAKELKYAFDVKPNDKFFWFTDMGWMMGPWEVIGVLFQGATLFIYEGAPDYPEPDRVWKMVEKHQLTHLGISPTAIRLLKKSSDDWVNKHEMKSLRILGSTGEPWDPESYNWFFEKVGKKRCPIINISGGTELVGCLLSPYPITDLKPCTLRGPGLGMDIDVFNEEGKSVRGEVGFLVCKKPFPSMTRGFLKDRERYLETYFSKWLNVWNHGDWAYVDGDGFWFLQGRADDTIKIAGKRVGPAEVESALNGHPAVAESAAIGVPHDIKGESLVCFVVLKDPQKASDAFREELKNVVIQVLGKTLAPEKIEFVPALPKTRSAKIVRGAIRKKYLGQPLGDTTSIENPETLDNLKIH
ncbi:MAG: AMP-dependent synthetase [Deltaproteobacteria bacterium RIFCSPLOWO2_01_44_7]|nr:MAG: AMP-dependent synthetase [Deltaproteobacteria bacterium RIFCSPHIGHO2_01_FULL_43_49]OGQ14330.1 MAG: AMP-dependent synthetase [Deltaproteobacteria bacterium RIFCSPHIGHO2_02_FULL_44_53]OGQ27630.1 MAG: AMP-dependent synthetase [Deltaproteobacteria bacterium RIFCSPHIGHO2_12_FULL_44_21]OGQ30771.1 MAG: AMP-dependent synthetase [Deltaproteobacteria bacterium RIFCSPLOWO2_01_FULL_45_74]OGQ41460.1 MAG: AMP-dependent synthetase [Deltaproteobacteria bacterium RIFCSPLOWO2_01_44_7]OGQ42451.1 MAG: AMP